MKIGIPKALLYYYYYPFWKVFFEELGFDVISSHKTTKELVDKGIKVSVPEICVPIKIFNGHVLELLEMDVDYLFIPRMMHIKKGEFFCPKFMGLPDMVRYSIPGAAGKILFPKIESSTDDISNVKNYLHMLEDLGVSWRKVEVASKKAQKVWKEFRSLCKNGYTAKEALEYIELGKTPQKNNDNALLCIGLMGYVYDIYDEFVSMGIVDRLKEMGIKVQTFEMIDEDILSNQLKCMNKKLFWTFSNKLIGAGYNFFEDSSIDGIIHVTAFGCGPDSLIGKVMELESIDYKKPFMTIRVDEHTGENHLQTRVEAFVDMIYRKKLQSKKEA